MAGPQYIGFGTLSLHAGQQPDPTTGARTAPIYQSTSFVFKDADHAASLFDVARAGYVYSRISKVMHKCWLFRMVVICYMVERYK